MSQRQTLQNTGEESQRPSVNIGNASNPAPNADPSQDKQLLGERAEKYLREVASIEDLPDAQDQEAMDETLKEEKGEA